MKNSKYINILPKEVRTQFMNNLIDWAGEEEGKNYLEQESFSFKTFMRAAFPFSTSALGTKNVVNLLISNVLYFKKY